MSTFIRAIELVVIVFMGVIVVFVIAETTLREVADTSLIVTDELSRYLMIWTAMLAASLLVYEDGHIQIDIFTNVLPPGARKVMYVCAQVIVLAFLGLVIYASVIRLPSMMGQYTITLGVSMVWFYAALPVSAALMFGLTLYNTVRRLRAPAKREAPAPGQVDSPL